MINVKKTKAAYITYSIVLIALGAALMLMPEISTKIICYIMGAIVLVCGITKIIAYFTNDAYGLAFQFDLALGIITVIVAIILLVHPKGIISFIDLLIGLFILIDGAFKLQIAIEAKSFGLKRWWAILLISVLTVLAGILLMLNPFDGAIALIRLIGIAFLIDGIENLIVALYTVKLVKRFSPILTEIEEMEDAKKW